MMSIHIPLLHDLHTSTTTLAIQNLSSNNRTKRMFVKGIGVFFLGLQIICADSSHVLYYGT